MRTQFDEFFSKLFFNCFSYPFDNLFGSESRIRLQNGSFGRTDVILDDFSAFNIVGLILVHFVNDFNQGSDRIDVGVFTDDFVSFHPLTTLKTSAVRIVFSSQSRRVLLKQSLNTILARPLIGGGFYWNN